VPNQIHAHPSDVAKAKEESAIGLKLGEFRKQSLRVPLAENVEPSPIRATERPDGDERDIADRHETIEYRGVTPKELDPLRCSIAAIAPQIQETDSLRIRAAPLRPRHGESGAR
jgi:hypothetical protein